MVFPISLDQQTQPQTQQQSVNMSFSSAAAVNSAPTLTSSYTSLTSSYTPLTPPPSSSLLTLSSFDKNKMNSSIESKLTYPINNNIYNKSNINMIESQSSLHDDCFSHITINEMISSSSPPPPPQPSSSSQQQFVQYHQNYYVDLDDDNSNVKKQNENRLIQQQSATPSSSHEYIQLSTPMTLSDQIYTLTQPPHPSSLSSNKNKNNNMNSIVNTINSVTTSSTTTPTLQPTTYQSHFEYYNNSLYDAAKPTVSDKKNNILTASTASSSSVVINQNQVEIIENNDVKYNTVATDQHAISFPSSSIINSNNISADTNTDLISSSSKAKNIIVFKEHDKLKCNICNKELSIELFLYPRRKPQKQSQQQPIQQQQQHLKPISKHQQESDCLNLSLKNDEILVKEEDLHESFQQKLQQQHSNSLQNATSPPPQQQQQQQHSTIIANKRPLPQYFIYTPENGKRFKRNMNTKNSNELYINQNAIYCYFCNDKYLQSQLNLIYDTKKMLKYEMDINHVYFTSIYPLNKFKFDQYLKIEEEFLLNLQTEIDEKVQIQLKYMNDKMKRAKMKYFLNFESFDRKSKNTMVRLLSHFYLEKSSNFIPRLRYIKDNGDFILNQYTTEMELTKLISCILDPNENAYLFAASLQDLLINNIDYEFYSTLPDSLYKYNDCNKFQCKVNNYTVTRDKTEIKITEFERIFEDVTKDINQKIKLIKTKLIINALKMYLIEKKLSNPYLDQLLKKYNDEIEKHKICLTQLRKNYSLIFEHFYP